MDAPPKIAFYQTVLLSISAEGRLIECMATIKSPTLRWQKRKMKKKDEPQKSGLKRKENVVTSNLKKVKKAWIYF